MKRLLLTSAFAMSAFAANATEINPYVSAKLGYTASGSGKSDVTLSGYKFDVKFSDTSGFVGNVAGGASFKVHEIIALRGEAEVGYAASKAKKMEVNGIKITNIKEATTGTTTLMLNGYADFGGTEWAGFNPYVGLGVGYGFRKSEVEWIGGAKDDNSGNGFAYALMTGVSYDVSSSLKADLGVKYMAINVKDGLEFMDSGVSRKFDLKSNSTTVMLGARYQF